MNDQIVVMGFGTSDDRDGSRDVNVLPDRRSITEQSSSVFSGYYQRVMSSDVVLDMRYGRYTTDFRQLPINPSAGQRNNVLYDPALEIPAYERQFGSAANIRNDENTRDYFQAESEWFIGDHSLKGGFAYTKDRDSDLRKRNEGATLTSLSTTLGGMNLGELVTLGVFDRSEVEAQILPGLNSNWSETSAHLDSNHDGVVSSEELNAATFGAGNQYGLNFTRAADQTVGTNQVTADRWALYVQDSFRVHEQLTLNAGLRMANNNYIDSNDESIVHIDTAFLPRVGAAFDVRGDGRIKISAFYGQYLDDIPMGMVHFAGNRSGSVTEEQIWLANDWYTYRVRGSAETLDSLFTPDVQDPRAHEANLSYAQDFGDGIFLSAQGYWRKDTNILEDYDFGLYFDTLPDDPNWSHLALDPVADFGYSSPEAVPSNVNYYQTNLVGAKREYYGLDLSLRKRFQPGHSVSVQYSFKDAKANSQSDGNADLQGDFQALDPRNPWMWGETPGTLGHIFKASVPTEPTSVSTSAVCSTGTMARPLPSRTSSDQVATTSYTNKPLNDAETDFVQPAWNGIPTGISST